MCYNEIEVNILTVQIEKLDHYGRGITRINGKICFVENALPKETVEIEIIKEWSDQKAAELGYTDTPNNNEDINQNQPNEDINQNTQTTTSLPQEIQQVTTSLPYAGTGSIIIGFIVLLIISAIISIIRYNQLKDAK